MRVSVIITLLVVLAIISTVAEAKKKPKRPRPKKPSKSKPNKSKGKLNKQQVKNIKMFKKLKEQSQKLANDIEKLTKDIEAAERLTEVSSRHTVATDAISVVDAHFTGNQCGPFTLSSYSTNVNVALKTDGTTDTAPFSGGTFTARANGWYHICSFSRFRNTGNSNDVNILLGGSTVIGSYGSAVTYDWRTTGICLDYFLSTGNTITVRHQSGGSNDCIQSTGWPYNKFTVHTIASS